MTGHLPLVSSAEMADIDARTIKSGTPEYLLIERAGFAVWRIAADRFEPGCDAVAVFLCGKGNNGADGIAAARAARRDGLDPKIYIMFTENEARPQAREQLTKARDAGIEIVPVVDSLEAVTRATRDANLIFDAMLGTGLNSAPRSPIADCIQTLAGRSQRNVVAVDFPSGLDADTGKGSAAQAELTVTFGVPKPVHAMYPGRGLCGRIVIADIGLDDSGAREAGRHISFARSGPRLPTRSRTAHKGEVGKVAVVAGSGGMTGAACLTAEAALRTGSGLVTLGLPESLNDIVETKLTEAMTVALPEVRRKRCLSLRARGAIRDLFAGKDAIAIGPGLGRNTETRQLVQRLIGDLTAPTVIDADGLNAFEGQIRLLREAPQPLILTPHPGEFHRLTGRPPDEPFESARQLAEDTGAIVVLKGAPTVLALPDGRTFANLSGNPGMATGGTGDVLTGIIVSLVGQGLKREEAALAGVYWHGLAGDLASDRLTERNLLASDIIATLPDAERSMSTGSSGRRYMDLIDRTRNPT